MKKLMTLAAVVAAQAAVVGVAVAPQLSARALGETYELRVAPLDPIDPFRGAYVTLDYPDLQQDDGSGFDRGIGTMEDGEESGDVFITLVSEGDVWVADEWLRERPSGDQPFLACNDRSWQVECGIDSFFLPQDEAAAMEDVLRDGAIAEVRIDGRGNAALIDVRAP
ncbi:GDYXXLXY domain-containing protein [Nocardioides sp. B-3]|uniref:GDYXXLXY domain-containing protein n=1 Tax=Nocardioides sp. B-3 TaxID=2895565 RepID=UPI0021526201|nr:GDYXXLXY domain-containing protein [Nocardioides sp. B-3]UUZ57752.1 GDYXXLXY domain-containing protein [Nocardioides sp. B-3]